MQSVIFDLDGTLADTSGDLIAAANATFQHHGLKASLDPEADRLTAFHGGRAMLRLGLSRLGGAWSEAEVDAYFPDFVDFYGASIDRHTVVYDGVFGALEQLKAAGSALGVCTNKPEGLARDLLECLGLAPYFGALLGADSLPVKKPDPLHLLETIRRLGGAPGRAVLIGDTATDRDTARAAKVPCILVAFGPTGRAVADMAPEALLEHYNDLPALLAGLPGAAR